MSEDNLGTRVGAAIQEWLDANGGGMATAWHLTLDFIDQTGEDRWAYSTAPDQKMVTTLGLLRWAQGVADYEQRRYFGEDS